MARQRLGENNLSREEERKEVQEDAGDTERNSEGHRIGDTLAHDAPELLWGRESHRNKGKL